METRVVIAFALGAMMVLILIAVAVRYFGNRRRFKIRQSGRGKNTTNLDGVSGD